MDFQPDMMLHDRYRIIKKLGEGGMGAVYLAWDETLEAQVAVKMNFNPAPESVAQFLKEAQLLAALRHQHLPRVTDYFVIGKEQYLVMDYIPGDDLGQRLRKDGPQDLNAVMSWASQLSAALNYMHNQNPPVTHRDIKPANIKLTSDGEAILVDFGIAKADSVQAHTAAGASGYTPGYAPPEQYGQGRTGPYSDQFSLAGTIYALLTQVKPADSIQRVLGKATLVPIVELNPQIPNNISDALLKAMSLPADDRFGSVKGFQEALENPGFQLQNDVREAIISTPAYQRTDPTRIVQPSVDAPSAGSDSHKRRNRNIALGVSCGVLMLGLLALGLILLLIPNGLLSRISAGKKMPTLTASPQAVEAFQATNEETSTSGAEETEIPLQQPTVTQTLEPLPTLQPEPVGESGVIAFASDRGEDGFVQIWTMNVVRDQGGDVRAESFTQLTFDQGDKDQPVWSPDGLQIAYTAPGAEGNGLDIWVMDADGGNQINITDHSGDEFSPVWAPNGSLIVFTYHIRDAGSTPIYALVWIKPDGKERERLSLDFVEWDATFSPDMKWLLYVISAKSHDYLFFRGAHDDFETPRGFDIRAIFGEFGEVSGPAWAPSGNQFAYTLHEGSNQNIVFVTYEEIRQNGVHFPNSYILTDTNSEKDPAWSMDARWLAFTSTRDAGDEEIYIMTTTGRPQVNLTSREGVDRSPNWKPVSEDAQ